MRRIRTRKGDTERRKGINHSGSQRQRQLQTDKANSPEDDIVTEMLKELLVETIYGITSWFPT